MEERRDQRAENGCMDGWMDERESGGDADKARGKKDRGDLYR